MCRQMPCKNITACGSSCIKVLPADMFTDHTMAANEGVTKAVASFYWGDSDTVFLDLSYDLRPNIIPANLPTQMCEASPCYDRDFRKRPGDFRRFPTTFQRLPNFAENVPTCSEDFLSTSDATEKMTIVACFDFIRTQSHHLTPFWIKLSLFIISVCPYLWVRREKLSLMHEIHRCETHAYCVRAGRYTIFWSVNFDGLKMVGNIGLWPAKTFEWRKVIQDLRNGGPLEMLTIAKLVTIKVPLHQVSNLTLNLHYMCLNFASKI